jgi:serine protease Do
MVVTNKHVVSGPNAQYRVITKDSKTYEVEKIYRDPVNDLAILKFNPPAGELRPVEMGDSNSLKVGQFVIAIGTALGEFRNTVTTGVISGLGRGVIAESPYEGYVEQLDNVIQTDAAINPGNSGGPLLNSAGQVIGVNVAVAAGVENIGFALPINVIKDSLENFNKTGKFSRPFLGVRYQMISQRVALLNEVPEGAYLVEVVSGSPADKADLKEGDIIVKIDGRSLKDIDGGLAKVISEKKVGETMELEVYRDEKTFKKKIVLEEFSQ